jgi:hypothetical protein
MIGLQFPTLEMDDERDHFNVLHVYVNKGSSIFF